MEKAHGGVMQTRGLPDLFGCVPGGETDGRAFGIEVKRPGGKPTPIQQANLDRMAAAGAITGVATSVSEALNILHLEDKK